MRQRLAKLVLRLPFLGRFYLKAMLKTLDRTPASKLPPQMRQVKTMLANVPQGQRLELLQAAVRGKLPQPEHLSRGMRRQAERQARRR